MNAWTWPCAWFDMIDPPFNFPFTITSREKEKERTGSTDDSCMNPAAQDAVSLRSDDVRRARYVAADLLQKASFYCNSCYCSGREESVVVLKNIRLATGDLQRVLVEWTFTCCRVVSE